MSFILVRRFPLGSYQQKIIFKILLTQRAPVIMNVPIHYMCQAFKIWNNIERNHHIQEKICLVVNLLFQKFQEMWFKYCGFDPRIT